MNLEKKEDHDLVLYRLTRTLPGGTNAYHDLAVGVEEDVYTQFYSGLVWYLSRPVEEAEQGSPATSPEQFAVGRRN